LSTKHAVSTGVMMACGLAFLAFLRREAPVDTTAMPSILQL
jgi:hypothetical protein